MKIPPVIIELFKRIASDNPKWAKRVQALSLVLMALAWTPELLGYLEIPSPSWVEILQNKVVKIGSLITLVLAQLPNPNDKKD